MAGRPTILDVAQAAGVSPATVDRVLNGRLTVRPETARRVAEAAYSVGYHAAGLIAQRLQPDVPRVRLGVVLMKERQSFTRSLALGMAEAAQALTGIRGEVVLRHAASQSPADMAAELRALRGRADAVAAVAVTHAAVTEAVADLQADGIPVFALLNDFAQGVRRAYLGLNNLRVGRIAANMVAAAAPRPGAVAVIVGGHRWHGHELRETGFRSYFREYAPQFRVLDTLVNLETRSLTYDAVLDLLARTPDLRGLYVAGGGMEGAIAALRETRRPGEVTLVVNELTPDSRTGLSDRTVCMVIATPLERLCCDAVGLMAAAALSGTAGAAGQTFLQPDLFLQESV